jgi:P4 family phage/plasmid primase-like protien
MMNDLLSFLTKKCKVIKGEEYSHTSMGYPFGSFYVPVDDTEKFYRLYTEAVQKGENIYITEKHKSLAPVVIDLDFRYEQRSPNLLRVYTESHLKEFLKGYMEKLLEYVEVQEEPLIYILEKPCARFDDEKNIVKDGIHIMIPNIVSKPTLQHKVREETLDVVTRAFRDCNFTNTADDIFDKCVIQKNNWLMYGSKKHGHEATPYVVTHVYKYNTTSGAFIDTKIPSDNFIIQLLSIRNKSIETDIKNEKVQIIKELENNLLEMERQLLLRNEGIQYNENKKIICSEEIEIVKELVLILSKDRSNSYDLWIKVGWCLRNIDNNLLDSWIEFSQKSDKYENGECEKKWNYMKDGGIGIGSLHLWARQDDKTSYVSIMSRSGSDLIRNSLKTGTDYDLSKVLIHYYQHSFRCLSIQKNEWYFFENHKWNKQQEAYKIRNLMSEEHYYRYKAHVDEWSASLPRLEDTHEISTENKDLRKKFNTIVSNMKNVKTKNTLTKQAADIFHEICVNEEFAKKLDANTRLICFNNGVFDFDNCEFRDGRPEDYISFSTGIDYVEYDETEPVFTEINAFLSQVQPNKEKREYILRMLARALDGDNSDEKVYFWCGEGGNGKSKLYSLLENCLGDYAVNVSVSYLTQKRSASNQASPEVMKTKGTRLVVFQEPEADETINVGIMKEISGGDRLSGRGLFKDVEYFTPQFQIIFICNQLPSLPADDGGTWRRVRKITFDSKFVEQPNANDPNEFKIDNELEKKWPLWKVPFMSLLIHYYKKFKNIPNIEPVEVTEATRDYQYINDDYAEFIQDHLEQDNTNGSEIELIPIFEAYKEFCTTWNRGIRTLKKPALQKAIAKTYPDFVKKNNKLYFKNVKLVNINNMRESRNPFNDSNEID